MNIDVLVDKLVTLTRSQRRGLYVILYILIVVMYLLAFLTPTYADIQSFQEDKDRYQSDLDLIKNKVGSISDLESESVQLKLLLDDAKEVVLTTEQVYKITQKTETATKEEIEDSLLTADNLKFTFAKDGSVVQVDEISD